MKLFFLIILSIVLLEGCGVKSKPEYQGKVDQVNRIIL
ncbi:MAG: hypothetical protein FD544_000406 [Pelagibacterales bacterium]|jgi:hypothetical protein|nr:hypothetical protein [Pelagibacterales bacterium]